MTVIKPILFFIGGLMILGSLGQLSMNREAYMYSNTPQGKAVRVIDPSYELICQDIQTKVFRSSIVLVFGVVLFIGSSIFLENPENKKSESIQEHENLMKIIKKRLANGEISIDQYDELMEKIMR